MMNTTLKDLIRSINKLSSTYYDFSNALLKSAEPIDKTETVKKYFTTIIEDINQVFQFLKNSSFESNPVAKLAIYYLYESFKSLLATGEGVNETLSLISYIKSEILKSSESGEGYSLFDAKKSNQNKELFTIQNLMDKHFYVSNLDGRLSTATKTLFPTKNIESLPSRILTNIPAQLSVKQAPKGFEELQANIPAMNWDQYLSQFEGDADVEGSAYNIGMDLAGIGVVLGNVAAELASSKAGEEGGKPSPGQLHLGTFGRAVQSLVTKSEKAEEKQNSIITDYSKKLEDLNNKIKSGELPIQLVRQARETKNILEKLVAASKSLQQLIDSELIDAGRSQYYSYQEFTKVKTLEPAYLESEEGKKELQDAMKDLELKNKEYADIYAKVCKAYDRVRYFKYQLDIVDSAKISTQNYKTIVEELPKKTIEYVDEDGSNVKRPGSIEDITKIQELNRAIVEDRQEYHLRGANKVNLVSLMTELFNKINSGSISESGLNDIVNIIGKIYTIEQKSIEESRVKRQENIEAKRKVEIKHQIEKEKRLAGELGHLESAKNVLELLMESFGGTRSSKAKPALATLINMFKDPASFQSLVPKIEQTDARDLFANLRIRILIEAFKISSDPKHKDVVRIFGAKDAKIAASAEFKEFVLKCQTDLSEIDMVNKPAFGKLIEQTYKDAFASFIRKIFVSEPLSNAIVNSNAKLVKIKKEFLAIDATSDFIEYKIFPQYLRPYDGISEKELKEFFSNYTKEKAESLIGKLEELKVIAEDTKSGAFIEKISLAETHVNKFIQSLTTETVISPSKIEEEIDSELKSVEESGDESAMIGLIEGMYDLSPEDIREFVESADFANIAKSSSPEIRKAGLELSKILEQHDILAEMENWETFQLEDFVKSNDYKEMLNSKSESVRQSAKKIKQLI